MKCWGQEDARAKELAGEHVGVRRHGYEMLMEIDLLERGAQPGTLFGLQLTVPDRDPQVHYDATPAWVEAAA